MRRLHHHRGLWSRSREAPRMGSERGLLQRALPPRAPMRGGLQMSRRPPALAARPTTRALATLKTGLATLRSRHMLQVRVPQRLMRLGEGGPSRVACCRRRRDAPAPPASHSGPLPCWGCVYCDTLAGQLSHTTPRPHFMNLDSPQGTATGMARARQAERKPARRRAPPERRPPPRPWRGPPAPARTRPRKAPRPAARNWTDCCTHDSPGRVAPGERPRACAALCGTSPRVGLGRGSRWTGGRCLWRCA